MLARLDDSTSDSGPRNSPPGTARLCAATRKVQPVDDMIRFVVGPDGDVVADLKRRLPGRGVWVTARRSAVAEAIRRRAFARGFRRDVRVSPDLPERIDALLVRSALDALAIAGKAGQVVTGFRKVEAALASKPVAAVLNAADAAPDGVRKLAAATRAARGTEADRVAIIDVFASTQLDLALGRSNVIHAALLTGRESDSFLTRCATLERFRIDDGREGGQP